MRIVFKIVLIAGVVHVSGCQQMKQSLGLERKSPDEFAVYEHAPLVVPPSLNELPEPEVGSQRDQEVSPKEEARKALIGASRKGKKPQAISKGENSFLQKAIGSQEKLAGHDKSLKKKS